MSAHGGRVTVSLSARVYATLTDSTDGADPDTRSLTPITPGTATAIGAFGFPVASGRIDPAVLTGSAMSRGGIQFNSISDNSALGQQSDVQFELTAFALDLSTAPAALTATFSGTDTYHDLPIASLVTSHVHRTTQGRRVTITGIGLRLLAAGERLFNQQAFGGQASGFRVGQTVGTASLTTIR